jgi:hypothetical protein
MQLDFTAIRGNLAEKPLESPVAAFVERDSKEVPVEPKTPQKAPQRATEGTETAGRLLAQYRQEKAEHERTIEVYREYQKNIRESGSLRTDILKGAKAGEPPVALLLKAVKCISLMTGDTVFYSQLEGDIKSIYGAGLLEPEPLKIEIQETRERLQRLQKALERDTEPADSKQRIERAIQAHKDRISQLQGLIEE